MSKETCGNEKGIMCEYASSAKFIKGEFDPYWECNKYHIKLEDKDNFLQKCDKCKLAGDIL